MKKRLPILLLLLSLLVLPGCRHPAEDAAPHHQYSACILLGPSSSPLWTSAFPSIKTRLENNCDMGVQSLEWHDDQTLIGILDRLGSEKISLIVCSGQGNERAVELVAPRYPETLFLVQNTRLVGGNIRALSFRMTGASYLSGIAAGLLGRSGEVAVIRGCGGPWLETVESSFRDGLRSLHPRQSIRDFSSVDALLSAPPPHASIALYACDAPDPATLHRASEAGLGLIGIGAGEEEAITSPFAGRILIKLAEALRRVAEDRVHGMNAEAGYDFDLGSGVIDFRVNPQLEILNTPEAREKLKEARSAITAGVVELEQMGM